MRSIICSLNPWRHLLSARCLILVLRIPAPARKIHHEQSCSAKANLPLTCIHILARFSVVCSFLMSLFFFIIFFLFLFIFSLTLFLIMPCKCSFVAFYLHSLRFFDEAAGRTLILSQQNPARNYWMITKLSRVILGYITSELLAKTKMLHAKVKPMVQEGWICCHLE